MKTRTIFIIFGTLSLILAACGGGDEGGSEPTQQAGTEEESGDSAGSDAPVSGGDVFATVNIGGETWELTNVACVVRTNGFELIAAEGIIGASSGPTVGIKVEGDPLDPESGIADVVMFSGPMTGPDLLWRSTTDVGGASVTIDGSRVSVIGRFDDGLTTDSVEEVDGTVESDCGEMPEVPVVTTTLPPDYDVDGTVSVGGETFSFTYSPEAGGQCGSPSNDGRVGSRGWLVDDPTRDVTFTYGLPEATPDGEAHMQLIITGADGQQLWYSAVGFIPGSSTGSVDSLTRNGDTVTATGTLLRSGSEPEELAEFTLEATCNQ